MENRKEYTAVIRTLGKGGSKYKALLDSLVSQSNSPKKIIVYIAEGYPIPKETCGIEEYVYVKKGMVSQRALPYYEVDTQYILFLDDDVYLQENSVEVLFDELEKYKGDVISPCVFDNHKSSIKHKILTFLTGRERPHSGKSGWGFKVMSTAGFSYPDPPRRAVYRSQTNAGPCFLCRKDDFLSLHYEDEVWLEKAPYAFPDDQVMFYKMHLSGLIVLTSFDSGIVHLDASSTVPDSREKLHKILYSEYRNKLIFWHRFIYLPSSNLFSKIWKVVCIGYLYTFQTTKYFLKWKLQRSDEWSQFWRGRSDAIKYLKSSEYKCLPKI